MFKFSILFVLSIFAACNADHRDIRCEDGTTVFETRWAEYRVSQDGLNVSLVDKNRNRQLLKDGESHFMVLFSGDSCFPSSSVSYANRVLSVEFESSGTKAKFRVVNDDNWLTLETLAVEGDVDSLRLVNLNINIFDKFGAVINACYDSSIAVCVQALDVNINSHPIDNEGNSLYPADFVEAGTQFTRPGNTRILSAMLYSGLPVDRLPKAAIVICPAQSLAPILSELEMEFGLPHPTIGGKWGKVSDEIKTSYIFMPITEDDADEVIQYALDGGFGYIVTHPFSTGGHYLVDTLQFPHKEKGLKEVIDKIHAAGLKAGLHSNTGGISTNDPYVTPIPDPGLATCEEFILAENISAGDDEIEVTSSPAGMPDRYSYKLYGPGLHLRIADELISYEGYTTTKPYRFYGCRRGNFGTKPAAHEQGTEVAHMAEMWNHFTIDVNSPMLEEVSGRLASIINGYGFDWLYLDGAEILSAQGPGFYHVNRFVRELFSKIQRDVLIQASYVDNYAWHVVSRVTSNDFPFHAIRKYCEISRLGTVKYFSDNLCPTELGWWGFVLNNASHFSTLPEEIEYGCVKTIAYDKAISLQLYQKSFLDQHGRTREIMEIFKRYENLRLSGYFPESVKQKLREFGYDFKLRRDEQGNWYFRKISRSNPKYLHGKQGSNSFRIDNEFAEQPLKFRLRAAHTPADFEDNRNITLLDQSDVGGLEFTSSSDHLLSNVEISGERTPGGDLAIRLSASNPADTTSSWLAHTNYFKDYLDLTDNRMIGLWVRGDSSGALLNLHIGCQRGITIDHYIDLDFKGWKYFEIPQSEGPRVYDYEWPYLWKHSLVSLRWNQVDRVSIYLNNLPPNEKVDCLVGPVKALHLNETTLTDPAIQIGKRKIVFPGKLNQDEYLEYDGGSTCRFYGVNGHLKQETEVVGENPILERGTNSLEFGNRSSSLKSGSAWITVYTEGERIK